VSGLREAIEKGVIDPEKIVGVIGKTHGNGLVNDYTRGYLTLCLSQLIGDRLGVPAESVSKRIPFIFSGGVEGVLSPHYSLHGRSEPRQVKRSRSPSASRSHRSSLFRT
jgi:cyanuric acid amidohydrolase